MSYLKIKTNKNLILKAAIIFLSVLFLSSSTSISHPEITEELLRRIKLDQNIRTQFPTNLTNPPNKEFISYVEKQNKIDNENMEWLVKVVEKNGWPTYSMVGKEASQAAFTILQHSSYQIQKKLLPKLRVAINKNEALPQWAALLEDRILLREDKPQIYGTQLVPGPDGKFKLWPIADEANVDIRRKEVGLEPLEEYLKRFNLVYKKNQ